MVDAWMMQSRKTASNVLYEMSCNITPSMLDVGGSHLIGHVSNELGLYSSPGVARRECRTCTSVAGLQVPHHHQIRRPHGACKDVKSAPSAAGVVAGEDCLDPRIEVSRWEGMMEKVPSLWDASSTSYLRSSPTGIFVAPRGRTH
jgi:hypothetical protein